MKKISWVTHPQYDIPLPKNHKFTSSKFSSMIEANNTYFVRTHYYLSLVEVTNTSIFDLSEMNTYISSLRNRTFNCRKINTYYLSVVEATNTYMLSMIEATNLVLAR